MKERYLDPIDYSDSWHSQLYKVIMSILITAIFKPLLKATDELARADNAKPSALEKALRAGTIQFTQGAFRGELNAAISKEIKELGGRFSRGAWRLPSPSLPEPLQRAIGAQQRAMAKLKQDTDRLLGEMPNKLTSMINNLTVESMGVADIPNRVSIAFKKTLNKAMSVYPDLKDEGRQRQKEGYFDTEDKPIRLKLMHEFEDRSKFNFENFAFEIVADMRRELDELIMGGRPRKEIQDCVKAKLNIAPARVKFIARQETALLTTSFKKVHYLTAGIPKYRWVTVGDHIVRDKPNGGHQALNGQEFAWDAPPDARFFSTKTQCHPREDYNCRCLAKPIVEW